MKAEFNTAIIMITHDLGVIAGISDRVLVMYAGRIVERGQVEDIFYDPQHPYTEGLLRSMPRIDAVLSDDALTSIPGQPPNLQSLPRGCSFEPRCPYAFDQCLGEAPALRLFDGGRAKACHRETLAATAAVQA